MSQAVNPITVEVVRSGLAHIANEMATVLRKTSYNMMIYEVRDYCVGIVDPEGSILSQNFGALPIFLADLGPAIVDGVPLRSTRMELTTELIVRESTAAPKADSATPGSNQK